LLRRDQSSVDRICIEQMLDNGQNRVVGALHVKKVVVVARAVAVAAIRRARVGQRNASNRDPT
jgi:hypothetical protein